MKNGPRVEKQSGDLKNSVGKKFQIEGTGMESIKPFHDKCISGYRLKTDGKKKVKKKTYKKYLDEVVRFVEGTHNSDREDISSSQKNPNNVRGKTPRYNTQIRYLEHKYIQCNIVKTNENLEISLPEEIKSLLINLTFLLHELKQKQLSKSQEDICNIISKIATLMTELFRRPIKHSDHTSIPFYEIADKLDMILQEHSGPENEQYEILLREIKLLEQEVTQKDSEVKYVKKQIQEERARFMPEPTSLDDSLRNSIRKNQSLRAEIKYNKAKCRKYGKILAEKEQVRQKSLLELNNLREKCAKIEKITDDNTKNVRLRLPHTDSDVYHGGSLIKYIKSKVRKENKSCTRVRKAKTIIHNNVHKIK